MDFAAFEQLVLRVLFETDVRITPAHLAYLAAIPVKLAERHLAAMAEAGSLLVRSDADGTVEYVLPHQRRRRGWPISEAPATDPLAVQNASSESPAPLSSPHTAVLLSVLVPGAGHLYAGRSAAGLSWMTITLMGYACFFLPGLVLHGLCLVSAAQTRPARVAHPMP